MTSPDRALGRMDPAALRLVIGQARRRGAFEVRERSCSPDSTVRTPSASRSASGTRDAWTMTKSSSNCRSAAVRPDPVQEQP